MRSKHWDMIGRSAMGVAITTLIVSVVMAVTSGPATAYAKIAGISFLISIGCMFAPRRAERKEDGR